MSNYLNKYNAWLEDHHIDEVTKEELKAIRDDEKEIEDRFYKDLEFGTGGLRGVLGAGSNRMNIYTVRKATQGLVNYLLAEDADSKNKGVAIAYDSRRMSPEFAREAALVINANGVKAYVFESLRPTPELSFAVRELGCKAGIVITASHNPPEYNGYKVYWEDGCQVPPPKDGEIITEVNKVKGFDSVHTMAYEKAVEQGLYQTLGESIDKKYIEQVKNQTQDAQLIKELSKDLKIVYTPLHGTGNMPVRRALAELGYENVFVVPEQEMPDSDFSTVGYPNPEDPKAFKLAIELAKEKDADIIIGTDPDADRVGVVVKNSTGEFVVLSGNMTGILLSHYLLEQKKQKGLLPSNGVIINTIVSTKMIKSIAKAYNQEVIEVLTGFKYIGQKIGEFEKTLSHEYIFGFEESFGYLAGTYARDKDAVVASVLVCELAAYYKKQGLSLYEGLMALYDTYGYYKETLESITLKGVEGVAKINHTLSELKANFESSYGDLVVKKFRDYDKQEVLDLVTGEKEAIDLPSSNVLFFELENECWFCARPSGTEPKVKFYFGVKGETNEKANEILENLKSDVMGKINKIINQ